MMDHATELRRTAYVLTGIAISMRDDGRENASDEIVRQAQKLVAIAEDLKSAEAENRFGGAPEPQICKLMRLEKSNGGKAELRIGEEIFRCGIKAIYPGANDEVPEVTVTLERDG